jgi:hypothetical protein
MKLNKKIIAIIIIILIIISIILIIDLTGVLYPEYSGKVLDLTDESPIPNAKIEIFTETKNDHGGDGDEELIKTIFTDSRGKYRTTLRPILSNKMYIFRTSKEGYVNAYSHPYFYPHNKQDGRQRLDYNENMHLISTGSLSGCVTDENNNPIPNVNVVVMKEPRRGNIKDILMATTTNLEGYYSLEHLWAIECYVSFSSLNKQQQLIENFKIDKFIENKLNITLNRMLGNYNNITGNITYDEKSFVNSHIVFIDINNSMFISKCDSNGFYSINLKSNTYNIYHYALWYDNRDPEYFSEYSTKDKITISTDTNLDIKVRMTYAVD